MWITLEEIVTVVLHRYQSSSQSITYGAHPLQQNPQSMGQITSEPLSLHAVSCTTQLPPKTRQNENGGINFARRLSGRVCFRFLQLTCVVWRTSRGYRVYFAPPHRIHILWRHSESSPFYFPGCSSSIAGLVSTRRDDNYYRTRTRRRGRDRSPCLRKTSKNLIQTENIACFSDIGPGFMSGSCIS